MSFLKGKNTKGQNTLVAVSQVTSITATDDGDTIVELTNGESVHLELGFQSVTNRLKELGVDIA